MDKLSEIKERWNSILKETPSSPWSACDRHKCIHGRGGCEGQVIILSYPHIQGSLISGRDEELETIAHTPEDIAWLIAKVESLQNQEMLLRDALDYERSMLRALKQEY